MNPQERKVKCPMCGASVGLHYNDRDDTRLRYDRHRPPTRPPGDDENCDMSGEILVRERGNPC